MHNFLLWAPKPKKISLKLNDRTLPMQGPDDRGNWSLTLEDANPGDSYGFLLDEDPTPYPDPRSLYQPDGVHNLSQLYDHRSFLWDDATWQGPPLSGAIIYEMHIGTFTPAGTFDDAIEKLPFLNDLGITHIEVMPIAEFAGSRGWGYDGVDLFAVNHCYGGPGPQDAPERLLDAMIGWVEDGRKPGPLVLNGGVGSGPIMTQEAAAKAVEPPISRTTLICPYPQKAVFTGRPGGYPYEASTWTCK